MNQQRDVRTNRQIDARTRMVGGRTGRRTDVRTHIRSAEGRTDERIDIRSTDGRTNYCHTQRSNGTL